MVQATDKEQVHLEETVVAETQTQETVKQEQLTEVQAVAVVITHQIIQVVLAVQVL